MAYILFVENICSDAARDATGCNNTYVIGLNQHLDAIIWHQGAILNWGYNKIGEGVIKIFWKNQRRVCEYMFMYI